MSGLPHTYIFLDQEDKEVFRLCPEPAINNVFPFCLIEGEPLRVRVFSTLADVPANSEKLYAIWQADFQLCDSKESTSSEPQAHFFTPQQILYYKEVRWAEPSSKRILEI